MENFTTTTQWYRDVIYTHMGMLGGNCTGVILLPLLVLVIYRVYQYRRSYIDLPYIGIPPGLLGPWKAGYNFLKHSEEVIWEGYTKYAPEGRAFVVATLPRYMVFLTDPAQIEELSRASDDDMGFYEAVALRNKADLTADPTLGDYINNYHVGVIRQSLTQRMVAVLPEMLAEAHLAWEEKVKVKVGDDWTRVKVWDVMFEVIARTTNRCFVGVPLCRNREYLDIMRDYAATRIASGYAADLAPFFLRPAVIWFLLWRHRHHSRAMKILGPIFDERRRRREECGDERWNTEKPDDALQWMLDAAAAKSKRQQSNEQLTWRMLALNFAGLHTTSLSILHILYDLTAHPEYIAPLREEIISVLDHYGGYTKQSLTMMKKLDSCLKESQRYNSVVSITMSRLTMRDYTFKSGRVPLKLTKGTFVTVPATAMHLCEGNYGPDATEWKGFRFTGSPAADKDAHQAVATNAVATNTKYLAFSHGRHVCPGRFFAVNELKMVLTYVLLRYDIRLPGDWHGRRPENTYVVGGRSVDTKVELEFRPREEWKELKGRWGKLFMEDSCQ